jgi:Tol biopolymer transport system component
VLIWAYCHHFCAGIRYLFLDLNKGLDLPAARMQQLGGARCEPCRSPPSWSEAMVNRVVTGAHYGLRDWLAQRINGR